MQVENSIQLRPRFSIEINKNSKEIIANCEKLKPEVKPDYLIRWTDNYIWLHIGHPNKKYYSPHLYLELEELENGKTSVKGLYGPDQSLWTLFMFFHFIIGSTFLIFCVIAYSNWSLKQPYLNDVIIIGLMTSLWLFLYFFGRVTRQSSVPQMHELDALMHRIVD